MEAYYDFQGLHSTRVVSSSATEDDNEDSVMPRTVQFLPCTTSEEKQAEKEKFYNAIRTILPASFRIGQDCPEEFRERLVRDVQAHVGKSIEIQVDLPSGAMDDEEDISSDNEEVKDEDVNGAFEEHSAKQLRASIATDNNNNNENASTAVQRVTKIIHPARPIPFIPHAYQLSVDRRTIRRNPQLSEFHNWLKVQTSAGFLTRQETVSMIPPVVLGVESHHTVLDMCAAPGSKTSQMLEIVAHILPEEREPRGVVVANDSDAKRAFMLVHQLRRINCPAIFVTSCDAQFFPQLDGAAVGEQGIFDRVLADVPCSGDGTLRKNPGIWKRWNQIGALGLHPLQLSIALTGARLTKVGGCMCYSTCSMNPIENEAVVAELLRLADGSLELVDNRADMPGLVARPGWETWKVMGAVGKKRTKGKNKPKMIQRRKEWAAKRAADEEAETGQNGDGEEKQQESVSAMDVDDESNEDVKDIGTDDGETTGTAEPTNGNSAEEIHHDWEEEALRKGAIKAGLIPYDRFEDVPEIQRRRVRKSYFPPTVDECSKMHLERCLRCLPHDMNTGGFFVALLKKTAPIGSKAKALAEKQKAIGGAQNVKEEATESTSKDEACIASKTIICQESGELCTAEPEKATKPRTRTGKDLGNSDFVVVDEAIWPPLETFYGFSDEFPKDQFMARECGKSKVVYFITKVVKDKLIGNGIQKKVMVINSGLKALERNSKECDVEYRVTQEGIHYVAPYMTKRVFVVDARDFCICNNAGGIWIGNFSETFQEQLRALSQGSFVVALEGFENDIAKKMFMVMWRCRGDALNCLVSKGEQQGIESKLRALGLLVNVQLKKAEKREKKGGGADNVENQASEDIVADVET